jgi:hypothetical protein
MKRRSAVFAAPMMALVFSLSASGATTIVASGDGAGSGNLVGDSNQWNTGLTNGSPGSPAASFNIAPNSVWATIAGAGWISPINNRELGDAGNGKWVDFYQVFNIATPTSGNLRIFADDRADVYITNSLNSGNQQAIYTSTVSATNGPCNLAPIGCITQYEGNFDITSKLAAGTNTLRIRVYQTGGGSFGTTYLATISTNPTISTVPEPGFYGVLSLGLGGLFMADRRRRRKNATN